MKSQSLQEQLLKAGLVNDTKVKQLRTEKRKQSKKQRHNKANTIDETKQLAQDSKAKQLEKDQLLNQQRNKEADKKQLANQIAQLVQSNKLAKDDDGVAYNFTDQNKVKTIYISEELRIKIIAGKLAIVKSGGQYEVVPVQVAAKIKQLDKQSVMVLFDEKADGIDGEYQGYEIPDDLMW